MGKIKEITEKTIILDNMQFASNFRETLLKENR